MMYHCSSPTGPDNSMKGFEMRIAQIRIVAFSGFLLFALAAGLLGHSGFAYAADRTVFGELKPPRFPSF